MAVVASLHRRRGVTEGVVKETQSDRALHATMPGIEERYAGGHRCDRRGSWFPDMAASASTAVPPMSTYPVPSVFRIHVRHRTNFRAICSVRIRGISGAAGRG